MLVHEPGLDDKEVFVLVYAPFQLLCFAAEDREINFGLILAEKGSTRGLTCGERFAALFALNDPIEPDPTENFKLSRLAFVRPRRSGEASDDGFVSHACARLSLWFPQLRGNDEYHPVNGNDSYPKVARYFFRPAMRNYLVRRAPHRALSRRPS